MENHNNNNDGGFSSVRAKIMAHPHYHCLLAAYVNCQKTGPNQWNLRDEVTRVEVAEKTPCDGVGLPDDYAKGINEVEVAVVEELEEGRGIDSTGIIASFPD
ncbi:Homeobox protein SBH1 [Camellia lanceoleosa]|uniref:Homeobox protein SBH1 n=1 Tax=Camellia lanceoleosa TaxID=1840588 RepID=A0ACC0G7V7_9ERIC|nr:Homeobox protein SBH1 [Camellia lanceoleosa]